MKKTMLLPAAMMLIVSIATAHADCSMTYSMTTPDHSAQGKTPTGEDCKTRNTEAVLEQDGTYHSKSAITHQDGSSRNTEVNISKETGLQVKTKHSDVTKEEYSQFGGTEWPDNEYTRRIPRPTEVIAGAYMQNMVDPRQEMFLSMLTFKQGTSGAERVKAYIQKMKDRGLTLEAYELLPNSWAPNTFLYRAKDSAGYLAEAGCTAPTSCDISVYSPRAAQKKAEEERQRKAKRAAEKKRKRHEMYGEE